MKTTYAKTPGKARRITACFLALLMCLGAVNTGFYGNMTNSLYEESFDMSVAAAEGDVRYDANATYYDSGTMWLQAYYSTGNGTVDNSDTTSVKTNGAYVYDASHYHQADGWLTLDVDSNFDGADDVTVPATTDINEIDSNNIMSCWREYVGSEVDRTYGVNITDFGTPAASGQEFSYIACGTTVEEDVDGDGLNEIRIDWQLRAWPADKGAAPTSEAEIEAEWQAIVSDINADKNNGSDTYTSDFYNTYAPEWVSGNTWYDDWIASDVHGTSVSYTGWDSEGGASYDNVCSRVIEGVTSSNIWAAIEDGDNLTYVYNNSSPWLKIEITNNYASQNLNVTTTAGFNPFDGVTGSEMNVYMPVLTDNGDTYKIASAPIFTHADGDFMHWTLAASAFEEGTSDLDGVTFGIPNTGGGYSNFIPNVYGVINTLWPMTRDEILTPYYTAESGGEAPSAYRLYGIAVKKLENDASTGATILDLHSLDDYAYWLAYGDVNGSTYTPNSFLTVIQNVLNTGRTDAQVAEFSEIADSATTQMNVGLVYDVTYDQQRAGGDISGYIEPESDCTITTELTDDATGSHYIEAAANVVLNEEVTYTFTGTEPLGKKYVVNASLYEVEYTNGAYQLVSNTPIATTASDATTINSATGSITVQYTIDASTLDGKTVVSYATLSRVDNAGAVQEVVATHEEAGDTAEQVTFTTTYIETDIISTTTDTRVVPCVDDTTVEDTISATGLIPGEDYYVKGKLVYEDASGTIVTVPVTSGDANNMMTSATQTAPANGDLTFELSYTFDATELAGNYVVAYAYLYNSNDELVFIHENFKDERQTAYIPSIETEAIDNITGSQQGVAGANDEVVDTVSYTSLVPNVEYTLKGTINVINGGTVTAVDTAETTFTPTDYSGTATVTFEYDSSNYAGKTFVVYEELYVDDVLVATHEDMTATSQMIYYPSISTSAVDGDSDGHTGRPSTDATVIDTVSYQNLVVGETYIIRGALMTKDDNGNAVAVEDASGNAIISDSGEFMTVSKNGSEEVEFTFDATDYDSVVVYERLYHVADDGTETLVAVHEDIDDDDQTVLYNNDIIIDTVALDAASDSHSASAAEDTVIEDEVVITGLTNGVTYTITGNLVDASNGAELKDADGKTITATMTFTATGTTATKTLVYDYDYSNMTGKSVVAVVTLTSNGTTLATHDSLTDADQTVSFPSIDTVASADASGAKFLDPIDDEVIVDVVTYTGLIGGHDYRLVGKLYDKTAGAFVNAGDVALVSEVTFEAAASGNGTVNVEFANVDYSKLAGHDIVVYQYLYDNADPANPVLVLEAADINDADETVHVNNPTVNTVLAETSTGNKYLTADTTVTLTDTITYTNLISSNSYVVVSKLVDKTTGQVLKDDNGKDLIVEIEVTGKTTAVLSANFSFSGKALEGKTVVAYNYLYRVIDGERHLVISEEDLTNAKQTVVFPSIDTVATDKLTGGKTLVSSTATVINDRVDYTGLEVGVDYTLTLTVYDKATGQPLAGVAPVTHTFRPTAPNGSTIVSVTVNTTQLQGRTLVMFETLKRGNTVICTHADINDADQTVYVPSIDTLLTAGDGGAKTVNLGENVVITDTITYTGLTPGQTYVITGQIIDRETRLGVTPATQAADTSNDGGAAAGEDTLDVSGQQTQTQPQNQQNTTDVVAQKTVEFTPTTANGTITVTYTINTTNLHGHHLVAFETVTAKTTGSLIMEHKDLNDEDQTVLVKTTTTVDTGVENFTTTFAIISVVLLLGFVVFTVFTVRRRKKEMQ